MNKAFLSGKTFLVVAILFSNCSLFKPSTKMDKTEVETQPKPITPPQPEPIPPADMFLHNILSQYPQYFKGILENKKKYNLQIIYTQINRDKNQQPSFDTHTYNVNTQNYFYPASTIKLPIAVLALQKLNELKAKGIDKTTTMLTDAAYSGQTAVYNDPSTPNGKPTIAHYIKKIFMVSDNDAFNRLYEFLGQDYINKELQKKGYSNMQVLHRLQLSLTENENRITNPIRFLSNNGSILYKQELQKNASIYAKRNDILGKGYYKGDVLINEPMDFSKKNQMALQELHEMLTSIIFPEAVIENQRFNISADDRAFLLKYMSQLSIESTWPPYGDEPETFWLPGGKSYFVALENGQWPKAKRVFAKTGGAYGHLLETAYVVDFEKNTEFILSATIYCNEDGILNDDKYDYETVGYPFLKNLGSVISQVEVKRKRDITPNLSEFKIVYDK